jgi:hypothetical protein
MRPGFEGVGLPLAPRNSKGSRASSFRAFRLFRRSVFQPVCRRQAPTSAVTNDLPTSVLRIRAALFAARVRRFCRLLTARSPLTSSMQWP